MQHLNCAQCPWSDDRHADTRAPSTCPSCGGNAITTDDGDDDDERRRDTHHDLTAAEERARRERPF